MRYLQASCIWIHVIFSCAEQPDQYYLGRIRDYRHAQNTFMRSEKSPLSAEMRRRFDSLSYFEPNPEYRFFSELHVFGNPDTVTLATTTGKQRNYIRAGKLRFELQHKQELTLYQSIDDPSRYFLPFKDATNGTATYGGGRYLDLRMNKAGKFALDFNYAYNPYCTYNSAYDCPIPPPENHLAIPIQAGERAFSLKVSDD